MKIFLFILGLIIATAGLGLTVYGWYVAAALGRITDGLSYSGPVLLVLGCWRVLSSAMAVPPAASFRIVAVGLAIGAGFGNTAILKAVFPDDKIISTNSSH